MESEEHCLFMAESLKKISLDMGFNLIFKSSFDKANRTSANGERGLGLESSIDIFSKIKKNMKNSDYKSTKKKNYRESIYRPIFDHRRKKNQKEKFQR